MVSVRFSGSFDDLNRFLENLGEESNRDLTFTASSHPEVKADVSPSCDDPEDEDDWEDDDWDEGEGDDWDDSDYETYNEAMFDEVPRKLLRRGKFDDEDRGSRNSRSRNGRLRDRRKER